MPPLAERESEERLRQEEEAIIQANEQALQQTLEEIEQLQRQLVPENCFSGRLTVSTEVIGQGAFGVIYKGLDPVTGMSLAVKVVKLVSASEEEVRNEIWLLEGLNHPHIVRLFGIVDDAEGLMILTELCECNLGEMIQENMKKVHDTENCVDPSGEDNEQLCKGLPSQTFFSIAYDLACTCSFMHKAGVVHRDLKPQNILFDRNGVLKLCDFGLARAISTDTAAKSMTMMVSTPVYTPPECFVLSQG